MRLVRTFNPWQGNKGRVLNLQHRSQDFNLLFRSRATLKLRSNLSRRLVRQAGSAPFPRRRVPSFESPFHSALTAAQIVWVAKGNVEGLDVTPLRRLGNDPVTYESCQPLRFGNVVCIVLNYA
jgi:hypothetical protein